jgi:exonuclease III
MKWMPYISQNISWVQVMAERSLKREYIFLQEDLHFTTINLQKYCKERDIEIVAIQLKLNGNKVIILSIYRAPTGNYDYFLNKLDYILNLLHRHNTEFILCGDMNINYLKSNNRKVNLVEMLNTYNLRDTVYFPLRITKNSATLTDNIFIDKQRRYNVKPYINGLSDHDA